MKYIKKPRVIENIIRIWITNARFYFASTSTRSQSDQSLRCPLEEDLSS